MIPFFRAPTGTSGATPTKQYIIVEIVVAVEAVIGIEDEEQASLRLPEIYFPKPVPVADLVRAFCLFKIIIKMLKRSCSCND